MRRLSVRLVLSHVLVAVLCGAVAYWVVRLLAPQLFDQSLHGLGPGASGTAGRGRGAGAGAAEASGTGPAWRDLFADAVDRALLVGTIAGVTAAALFGAFAAIRLLRSLRSVRGATRQIAAGRYDVRVPTPRENELAALASDVNALGATLGETEARRVRLLGEVAHELRTPLTVLDGSIEGMIDGVLPRDDEQLDRLAGEVRRLRRLSDDLSALSRAEEGRLSLAPVRVGLLPLVRDAVERLRPQADDAGLTLSVSGSDVTVEADPDRLAQVVTNLVGNAIRATASGSVSVRVGRDGATALVAVSDTGEGLDAADTERIFERFYRVPGRRGSSEGSGIGLTIARQIMRAHGGDLVASSPGRGRGATFTATLPAA